MAIRINADKYEWRFQEYDQEGFMYGPSQLQAKHPSGWQAYWWAVCPNPYCQQPSLCIWLELSRYDTCQQCHLRFPDELDYDKVYGQPRTLRPLKPEDQRAATSAFMLGGWAAAAEVCKGVVTASRD